MDSKHKGCELEPCTCHNENTIGEKGNWRPHRKINFSSKNVRALSLVSAMIEIEYEMTSNRVNNGSYIESKSKDTISYKHGCLITLNPVSYC